MRKYPMLRERLEAAGGFAFDPAPLAAREAIERVHDPAYVDAFLNGTLPPDAIRRLGFPWSEGLVRRTLASAGGTIAAADDALANGWGGTLAGGTHHAFHGYGSGYCVFNDIAIAIRGLIDRGAVQRAAVIDLDVHQGDGTAALLAGETAVLTVSLHNRNNFPFRKEASDIDVELGDDAGDDEFLTEVRGVLPRVFAHNPDIVFYQSGVDGLREDRLGRLALTLDGMRQRDELVLSACRSRVPVVVTLGGGYADPIERTVDAHAQTFQTALRLYQCADFSNAEANPLSVSLPAPSPRTVTKYSPW
ncbi:MAG: histone deacetylase [Bryobacteraceae bacterium]